MKRKIRWPFLLVLVFLHGCTLSLPFDPSVARPLNKADFPPESPFVPMDIPEGYTSLLDQRLFLKAPEGTLSGMSARSVMAADANDQIEDSLLLSDDSGELVFSARETACLSSGDVLEDATYLKDDANISNAVNCIEPNLSRLTPAQTAGGGTFSVALMTDDTPDDTGSRVTLGWAVVKNTDDSLQYISVYCDKAYFQRHRDTIVDTVKQTLSSLLPGDRKMNLSPRRMTAGDFVLYLPQNYGAYVEYGPDFTVCYVMRWDA